MNKIIAKIKEEMDKNAYINKAVMEVYYECNEDQSLEDFLLENGEDIVEVKDFFLEPKFIRDAKALLRDLDKVRADIMDGGFAYSTDEAIYALKDLALDFDDRYGTDLLFVIDETGIVHIDWVLELIHLEDSLSNMAYRLSEYDAEEDAEWLIFDDVILPVKVEDILGIIAEVEEALKFEIELEED